MNISEMEWQILYTLINKSLRTEDIAEEIERSKIYVSSYIYHLKKKKLIERDMQSLFGIRFKVSPLGITHLTKRAADLANESAKIQRLVGSPNRSRKPLAGPEMYMKMNLYRAQELIEPLRKGTAEGISQHWQARLIEALEYVIEHESQPSPQLHDAEEPVACNCGDESRDV